MFIRITVQGVEELLNVDRIARLVPSSTTDDFEAMNDVGELLGAVAAADVKLLEVIVAADNPRVPPFDRRRRLVDEMVARRRQPLVPPAGGSA